MVKNHFCYGWIQKWFCVTKLAMIQDERLLQENNISLLNFSCVLSRSKSILNCWEWMERGVYNNGAHIQTVDTLWGHLHHLGKFFLSHPGNAWIKHEANMFFEAINKDKLIITDMFRVSVFSRCGFIILMSCKTGYFSLLLSFTKPFVQFYSFTITSSCCILHVILGSSFRVSNYKYYFCRWECKYIHKNPCKPIMLWQQVST